MVVLPDHLFARALSLGSIEQKVLDAQEGSAMEMNQWREGHMLQNEDGRWTRDGRLVVPENNEI